MENTKQQLNADTKTQHQHCRDTHSLDTTEERMGGEARGWEPGGEKSTQHQHPSIVEIRGR